jgi:hypothetical protein
LEKEKTGVAAAKTNGVSRPHGTTEKIGYTKLKVTVHIPEKVQSRQGKINKIYDILKPA